MNTFKRKALFTAVLAALAVAASGCESFGAPRMSAEELQASAKDKNASVACATYDSLPVDGAVMYVNIDERVVRNGQLNVKCGQNIVTFTNAQPPFQVAAP